MYDDLKTFKPVFFLAAGPMICGAFILFFAALCKSTQISLGRQDVTSLVSSPKHCNGVYSSYQGCPTPPPTIVLTEPKERESLIIVERLTVIWFISGSRRCFQRHEMTGIVNAHALHHFLSYQSTRAISFPEPALPLDKGNASSQNEMMANQS